jgi:DNA-directed RNA polymerase subunit RPC12/RpoP
VHYGCGHYHQAFPFAATLPPEQTEKICLSGQRCYIPKRTPLIRRTLDIYERMDAMSILVSCKACGKKMQAPEKMLGQQARCPKCGAGLLIERRAATTSTTGAPADTPPAPDGASAAPVTAAPGQPSADEDPATALAAALGQLTDTPADRDKSAAAQPGAAAPIVPKARKPEPAKPVAATEKPAAAPARPADPAAPVGKAQSADTDDAPAAPAVKASAPAADNAKDVPEDEIALAPVGMQTPSGLPVRRSGSAESQMQRSLAAVARVAGLIMGLLALGIGVAALIILSLAGHLLPALGGFFLMLILAVALAMGGILTHGLLRMTADLSDSQRRMQSDLDELLSRD